VVSLNYYFTFSTARLRVKLIRYNVIKKIVNSNTRLPTAWPDLIGGRDGGQTEISGPVPPVSIY